MIPLNVTMQKSGGGSKICTDDEEAEVSFACAVCSDGESTK